ncbi:hypothetical protein LOOC260_118140 [Paucilactobacillus hokkaidonensis JCM 18461]|uniref:DUF4811 domain-containing protein n=2 Tax=Paucilactobacillus hokkaidonensis TaxID=1193095 RepID=A0A0A1GWD0_9LACO|nr:DUF4811 domain-containing protein [Paucilactobacillus hokkaidonensis]KRO10004.1 hypothetical protein IV59_GL002205 [Paucilactobacillus hokkaidonensis]BAP86320.1 hypothetical protein LOOC260_118140 [Paucilactobacillus hokkaidonensis JCM 18461]
MILVSLFVGVICFVIGLTLLKTKRQQWLVGGVGFILLVGSATLMIGNDTANWGMQRISYDKAEKIASVVTDKRMQLVVYQPIRKSNSEKVYIYRHLNAKETVHTQASLKTTNKIERRGSQAKLTTTTKYWQVKDGFWKFCFAGIEPQSRFISRKNTFILPTQWNVLSRHQADWLSKAVATKQKAAKREVKAEVTKKVQQAVVADPQMSKAKQQLLEQEVEKQAETQLKQNETRALQQLMVQAKQQSIR